jgi:hypothetical protein
MTSEVDFNFHGIFINAVSAADDYYIRGEKTVLREFENTELINNLSKIDFGLDLFSGHQNYMQSGFNSFLTLRMAMIPTGIQFENGKPIIKVNATVNGLAGLLRQSVENLARSVWLLNASDKVQISQRGFAVVWENAKNRLKFERALKSPRVGEFEGKYDDLKTVGIEFGFFKEKSDGKPGFEEDPRVRIQDATSLLKNISTPVELPAELLRQKGIGFINAEWVYRWLSGLTHGLDWVHTSDGIPGDQDFALVIRNPDFERFSISALYVLQIGQQLFDLTDGGFQMRLAKILENEGKPL